MSTVADAANRLSLSVGRNRPIQAPVGPRMSARYQRSTENIRQFDTPTHSQHSHDSVYSSSASSSPIYRRSLSPIPDDSKLLPVISELAPPTSPAQPPTILRRSPSPHLAVKPVPKIPNLDPPADIKFETPPVPWKGLSHEAALWTLSSRELQDIVSRAIRSSARESFVRLLSVNNLDYVLPAELERLHDLRRAAQSKYRFHVQRRAMLLRALNAAAPSDKDGEDGTPVVSRLVKQLCDTIRDCDTCLEEVLSVSDQIAQIAKLIDVHWASALAVALRKLNTSYGKRTADLNTAHEKLSQLEAELVDAWKEAERLAREMDDFDAVVSDYEDEGEAVIERAEIVSVPSSPTPNASLSILRFEAMSSRRFPTTEPDVPDSASMRSMKSTRSARSTRDGTHLSLVVAAKTRSHRASKGSLRLPGGWGTASRPQTPPVPDLPPAFASAPPASGMPNPWPPTPAAGQPRRRVSLEDIKLMARPGGPTQPSTTVDDIYLRPQPTSNEIEVVPRTPPHPKAVDDIHLLPPRYSAEEAANAEIPSIWLHADAPKTPAERVESLLQREGTAKMSSYHKLKTLTKRYSLPFPLFHSKSLQARPRSS